jgi:ribosomal protein S18 acetylase RimI-like enzyme
MRSIKRLAPKPKGRFDKLRTGALRFSTLTEERLQSIETTASKQVIEVDDAILVGDLDVASVELHYAFPNSDAFRQLFPSMFQGLALALENAEAPFGYRFRLTERSSRPYVEPVLTSLAFEQAREWMLMELPSISRDDHPSDEISAGFRLRDVTPEDVPSIIALEERAFESPQLTPDIVRKSIQTAAFYRVLEDTSKASIIGSLVGEMREGGTGHIAVLAVDPDYQRRGLGEAMTRWALVQLSERGARRATLTTNVDNAPAIALYRKLGFSPKEFGLDYRRPFDEEEVRQILERNRAEHLSMRPRWRNR